MSEAQLKLVPPTVPDTATPKPLGRLLVDCGALSTPDLVRALDIQNRVPAPLGSILTAEGWVDEHEITRALAAQKSLARVDLDQNPPDPALIALRPPGFWIAHRVLPWARIDNSLAVATAHPDDIGDLRAAMGQGVSLVPIIASESQIMAHLAQLLRQALAVQSVARVDGDYSCRTWRYARHWQRVPLALGLGVMGLALAAPLPVAAALCLFAVLSLSMIASLRLAGLVSYFGAPRRMRVRLSDAKGSGTKNTKHNWPHFSIMVPLFREEHIAEHLVARLKKIMYPKALVQVLLVLEEHDKVTQATLERTVLPPWIHVITVPEHGGLTTKPRAMNFALNFCDGDIIGVWDAEDAPAPNQLEDVAAHFARAPEHVACLQGVLDFYNPRSNWLARCFTAEYAAWFRVILPGIARLGLVVPLGGTTMFIRRSALDRVGAWDAHNVTEDADLGVRLARHGLVTEMIPTVTGEEANCRPWPWIKQRSRWLKGFMITYLVHMRHPRRLWRDLGVARFLGVQAFFLGTITQFLLAPLLWSFWLILLGLPHPVQIALPQDQSALLLAILLISGLINLLVGIVAVQGAERRHLLVWLPTMVFYFPLGAIASYKALWELATAPYFWDKTQHGVVRAAV